MIRTIHRKLKCERYANIHNQTSITLQNKNRKVVFLFLLLNFIHCGRRKQKIKKQGSRQDNFELEDIDKICEELDIKGEHEEECKENDNIQTLRKILCDDVTKKKEKKIDSAELILFITSNNNVLMEIKKFMGILFETSKNSNKNTMEAIICELVYGIIKKYIDKVKILREISQQTNAKKIKEEMMQNQDLIVFFNITIKNKIAYTDQKRRKFRLDAAYNGKHIVADLKKKFNNACNEMQSINNDDLKKRMTQNYKERCTNTQFIDKSKYFGNNQKDRIKNYDDFIKLLEIESNKMANITQDETGRYTTYCWQ